MTEKKFQLMLIMGDESTINEITKVLKQAAQQWTELADVKVIDIVDTIGEYHLG